jgi:hypothetical protein
MSSHGVCPDTPTADWVIPAVLYVGIAVAGFRRRTWLPVAWPLASVVGVAALLVLMFAYPGPQTNCWD